MLHHEQIEESFALMPLTAQINDIYVFMDEFSSDYIVESDVTSLLIPTDKRFIYEMYIHIPSDAMNLINDETTTISDEILIGYTVTPDEQLLLDIDYDIDVRASLLSQGKSILLGLSMKKDVAKLFENAFALKKIVDNSFSWDIAGERCSIAHDKYPVATFSLTPTLSNIHNEYISKLESINGMTRKTTSLILLPEQCFIYEELVNTIFTIDETEKPDSASNKSTIYVPALLAAIALCFKSDKNLLPDTKSYAQAMLMYTCISMIESKFNNLKPKDLIIDITTNLISCGKSIFLGLVVNTGTEQFVQSNLPDHPISKNKFVKYSVSIGSAMLSTIPEKFILNVESGIKNFCLKSDKILQTINIAKPQEQNAIIDAIYAGGVKFSKIITKELPGHYSKVAYALTSTMLKGGRKSYEGLKITSKNTGCNFIGTLTEKYMYDVATKFVRPNGICTLSAIKACTKVIRKQLLC